MFEEGTPHVTNESKENTPIQSQKPALRALESATQFLEKTDLTGTRYTDADTATMYSNGRLDIPYLFTGDPNHENHCPAPVFAFVNEERAVGLAIENEEYKVKSATLMNDIDTADVLMLRPSDKDANDNTLLYPIDYIRDKASSGNTIQCLPQSLRHHMNEWLSQPDDKGVQWPEFYTIDFHNDESLNRQLIHHLPRLTSRGAEEIGHRGPLAITELHYLLVNSQKKTITICTHFLVPKVIADQYRAFLEHNGNQSPRKIEELYLNGIATYESRKKGTTAISSIRHAIYYSCALADSGYKVSQEEAVRNSKESLGNITREIQTAIEIDLKTLISLNIRIEPLKQTISTSAAFNQDAYIDHDFSDSDTDGLNLTQNVKGSDSDSEEKQSNDHDYYRAPEDGLFDVGNTDNGHIDGTGSNLFNQLSEGLKDSTAVSAADVDTIKRQLSATLASMPQRGSPSPQKQLGKLIKELATSSDNTQESFKKFTLNHLYGRGITSKKFIVLEHLHHKFESLTPSSSDGNFYNLQQVSELLKIYNLLSRSDRDLKKSTEDTDSVFPLFKNTVTSLAEFKSLENQLGSETLRSIVKFKKQEIESAGDTRISSSDIIDKYLDEFDQWLTEASAKGFSKDASNNAHGATHAIFSRIHEAAIGHIENKTADMQVIFTDQEAMDADNFVNGFNDESSHQRQSGVDHSSHIEADEVYKLGNIMDYEEPEEHHQDQDRNSENSDDDLLDLKPIIVTEDPHVDSDNGTDKGLTANSFIPSNTFVNDLDENGLKKEVNGNDKSQPPLFSLEANGMNNMSDDYPFSDITKRPPPPPPPPRVETTVGAEEKHDDIEKANTESSNVDDENSANDFNAGSLSRPGTHVTKRRRNRDSSKVASENTTTTNITPPPPPADESNKLNIYDDNSSAVFESISDQGGNGTTQQLNNSM